jgi:DNA polymerase-3 subunit gamma/tau
MSTLYRKYRPKTFQDVVGQKHIVTTLTNALTLDRVGQAYLFTGPRGTGKTTLARIFAKAVNCLLRGKSAEPCGKCRHCILMEEGRSMDIIEIDAASHTGVDNIRELRETIVLPPSLGTRKIYIIDEVHMLSIGAFNALLKTLEEPPSHALFILATTALHKVPDTIVSRCQRFDLGRFPVTSIIEKLERIAKAEKMTIEPKALQIIALSAEGGMRDAESLLTQIHSLEVKKITEDLVIDILGTAKHETFVELFTDIQKGELLAALTHVRHLGTEGRDFRVLITGFMHFLRDLLLFTASPSVPPLLQSNLTKDQQAELQSLASTTESLAVVRLLEILAEAQKNSSQAVIPELPLEIAIVKMIAILEKQDSSKTDTTHTTDTSEQKAAPKKESITETPVVATSEGVAQTKNEPIESAEAPLIPFTHITDNWHAILEAAKELNASLSVALSTATPKNIQNNTVTLGVKYPFHKERLDDKANQLTLMEAFDRILGFKLGLKVEVEQAAVAEEATSYTDNPLISQALNLLGGKVAS